MRKIKQLANQLFKFTVFCVLVIPTLFFAFAYLRLEFFISAVFVALFISFLKLRSPKEENTTAKYIDRDGYVILSKNQMREHRYIAEQTLGRKLKHNEVVHHINGIKTDNALRNLCVMDRDDHEQIHVWLMWKKRKTGAYPSFAEQKKMLTKNYGGILLTNTRKNFDKFQDAPPRQTSSYSSSQQEHREEQKDNKLFILLKAERLKMSKEFKCPAYVISHDKTLHQLVSKVPACKESFLSISGMGEQKYQMYGKRLLFIIQQFKIDMEYKRNGTS